MRAGVDWAPSSTRGSAKGRGVRPGRARAGFQGTPPYATFEEFRARGSRASPCRLRRGGTPATTRSPSHASANEETARTIGSQIPRPPSREGIDAHVTRRRDVRRQRPPCGGGDPANGGRAAVRASAFPSAARWDVKLSQGRPARRGRHAPAGGRSGAAAPRRRSRSARSRGAARAARAGPPSSRCR